MRVALASLESFYDHSLALDYLVGYAALQPELAGVEFEVFVEGEGAGAANVVDKLRDRRPDVVGFNTYVWNIDASIRAAKALKAVSPGTVTVFGGMEATFNAAALLSEVPELDFVVVGEGEIPFSQLLAGLRRGEKLTGARPGLAWRNVLRMPVVGGLGDVMTNLDELPSPFQRGDFLGRSARRVLYESYRGCAFRCSFCLYQRDYAAQRYYSIERVKSDLDAIMSAGVTHVRFVDSTFNLNRRRAKEILRFLQGCNADVCVEVSAEFFDAEMVSLLPRAGVRHVDIGLQSTHSAALKAVSREWYREDRFKENLEVLRAEPALTLNVELIAGLPGDDLTGLRRSLDEAVLRWPDHVSVYRLLGLRGTPLARDAERLGLRFSSEPPYELVESAGFPPEVLQQIDELTFAHLVLFNLGVGRFGLRYLTEVFGSRPSDIYDEFVSVVLGAGLYSRDEARHLGRHHAYGNRFDQPMPPGLDLERVLAVTRLFFNRTMSNRLGDRERRIACDLVEFGHALATLDTVRRQDVPPARSTGHLRLAPWCLRRSYGSDVVLELVRQGHGLGDLPPEDVAGVVFFVHPDLGPAAVAVDETTTTFLDQVASGVVPHDAPGAEPLRELTIVV